MLGCWAMRRSGQPSPSTSVGVRPSKKKRTAAVFRNQDAARSDRDAMFADYSSRVLISQEGVAAEM